MGSGRALLDREYRLEGLTLGSVLCQRTLQIQQTRLGASFVSSHPSLLVSAVV